ncbi:arylsulfatase [Microbacterium oryzae]|uniref:arylsulfatase n=1 Tax=Microbacterium oryzae TaxID=743009 RepID=UPI0025AF4887|nr:arylsulfatase [Microbacterium oryzae]MDN3310212.1 arylsulfatase [Microbacterium oryzae]
MTRTRPERPGAVGRTIAGTEPWWPPRPGAGRRRPNVIVILVDDMGFSDVGCYGSEIPTPAIDAVAEAGTRFTSFHVTPLCSPTRASLLTGINHHRAGFAFVANTDPGMPNRTATFPADCSPLPEMLRDGGYATMAVGKWHLAPESEMHDAGSREMWPCQVGFDRFYGFLEAFTMPHSPPRLVVDNSAVDTDSYPEGYHVTDDLTDRAVEMIRAVRAADPEKPFFLYFGHAAVHGPLQAKDESIAQFADMYADGWSRTAETRFARQKELGLFPHDLVMAHREEEPGRAVPDWDEQTDEQRALYARMMQVYAGMIHEVDQSTARLLEVLDELGEREDTIIMFLSDNGATAEGGPRGTLQYTKAPPLARREDDDLDLPLDEVGGPRSMMHYPSGWAMTSNTPFRLFKASTHEGGVRSPLIVSWPAQLPSNRIREGYQYVTDIAATVLDLVDLPGPGDRNGRPGLEMDGRSFADALREVPGAEPRRSQHEEVSGHRSYYQDGWKAVTQHPRMTDFDDDRWELYHLDSDPGEVRDLAADEGERLDRLRTGWEDAAQRNAVYPLDEGSGLANAVRNPDEERYSRPLRLLPGTPTVERYRASKLVTARSFEVVADLEVDESEGVIFAHGGQAGGYVVYVESGHAVLEWNDFGIMHVSSPCALPEGRTTMRLAVEVGAARACRAELITDGETATVGGLTAFGIFAPFSGIDVGIDRRSPVSWDLRSRRGTFRYSGVIHSVTYTAGELAPDAAERRIDDMRAAASRFQ